MLAADGPCLLVFASFARSPFEVLAAATTCKTWALALEPHWPALTRAWIARWNPVVPSSSASSARQRKSGSNYGTPRRTSKRLREVNARRVFVRTIESAAHGAVEVHAELDAALKLLPGSRLSLGGFRALLNTYAPVWVDAGVGVKRTTLLGDVIASHRALADVTGVCRLLVDHYHSDVHRADEDGMRPLAAAAARGLVRVVELLLARCSCREGCLTRVSTGCVWTPLSSSRRRVRGSYTPLGWARAALQSGVESSAEDATGLRLPDDVVGRFVEIARILDYAESQTSHPSGGIKSTTTAAFSAL